MRHEGRSHHHHGLSPITFSEIEHDIYVDPAERGAYIVRFAVLMALSTFIATFGIATDSGPVVIGAMLVAPLMTPLLGLSGALVNGWPRRLVESALLILGGSIGAIGLAWVAAKTFPEPTFVTERSSELLSRTAPGTLDLSIALAAGAAGAYVTVHRKAVGAMPGAAIAVALLPPLSAVGIAWSIERTDLASGALLLFFTNLAGILLAASVTFIATGFVARLHDGRFLPSARHGLMIAAVTVLAISYPLGRLGRDAVKAALDESAISSATEEWIGDRKLEIERTTIEGSDVAIEVGGPDRPPSPAPLAVAVRERLGPDATLVVHYIPVEYLHTK
ncbi:DUF389 domain-containing protein [Paraconexibacter sp.]|uniref:DUF389 domain-containing protein n=1 Tax=Paraconexibacter sp. TaxID=2949640 RepID=UPI00356B2B15